MKGICQICEKNSRIVNHHISYFPEIIITLCDSCHSIFHHYDILCPPEQDYYFYINSCCIDKNFNKPYWYQYHKILLSIIKSSTCISTVDLFNQCKNNEVLSIISNFIYCLYSLLKSEFIVREIIISSMRPPSYYPLKDAFYKWRIIES